MSAADAQHDPAAGVDHPAEESRCTGADQRPLSGRSVVVTRAAAQSGELTAALELAGAEVVELALIRIVASPDNPTVLAPALALIDSYDWLIVTSPNGARCVCDNALVAPTTCRIAAVGAATAAALAPFAPVDLLPERSHAEGLIAEFPLSTELHEPGLHEPGLYVPGRVLLVQGDRAPPLIADHLAAHRWRVTNIVAYSTVAARPDAATIDRAAAADAITFLSGSAVRAFAEIVGLQRLPPVVVSIGASTSATLRELGVTKIRQSASASLVSLVEQVSAALQ